VPHLRPARKASNVYLRCSDDHWHSFSRTLRNLQGVPVRDDAHYLISKSRWPSWRLRSRNCARCRPPRNGADITEDIVALETKACDGAASTLSQNDAVQKTPGRPPSHTLTPLPRLPPRAGSGFASPFRVRQKVHEAEAIAGGFSASASIHLRESPRDGLDHRSRLSTTSHAAECLAHGRRLLMD